MMIHESTAWTTTSPTTSYGRTTSADYSRMSLSSTTSLWAKPPPISNFDLDAIEAYEAQLERQREEDGDSSSPCGDDFERTIDEDDTDDEDIRTFVVDETLHNKRIDAAIVATFPDLTRSYAGTLVTDQCVHHLVGEDSSTTAEQQ